MAFALAKEQQSFINRMVKEGRFNNQSEVVREALRQMEQNDKGYLNPPPLTKERLAEIYRPNAEADRHEKIAARTMHRNRGKLIKKLSDDRALLHTRRGVVTPARRRAIVSAIIASHGWQLV